MALKGIDLTHPQWIVAGAVRAFQDVRRPIVPAGDPDAPVWPTEPVLDRDRSFWAKVDRALRLDDFHSEFSGDVDELVVRVLSDEGRPSVDRTVLASENLSDLSVALAIPYHTPRLARASLHLLLNPRYCTESDRDYRTAVEAPVALALEYVARRGLADVQELPLLLLTGAPPTLELAAATLSRSGKALRVEVAACSEVDPADLAGSLGGFDPGGRAVLVHPGIAESAGQIRAELGLAETIDLGRHAVAIGAVRHGGLIQRRPLPSIDNHNIRELIVSPTAVPTAVGVLGTNDRGDWFWRRVIDRGTALSSRPVRGGLRLEATGAEKIALAECPNPRFAEKLWLGRQDWPAAGLRWHDVIHVSGTPAAWDLEAGSAQIGRYFWRSPHGLRWKVVARADGEPAGGPAP